MAINSCVKGKVGEREWRDQLRAEGFASAKRGQQHAGGVDSPDVICPELAGYHWEVKRVEKLNVLDAMLQAIRDAGPKTPVLAHRRNRGEWLVTMRAADWFKLLREALPVRPQSISVQEWAAAQTILSDPAKPQFRIQSPGWRYLNAGETVQEGDEIPGRDGWFETWAGIGCMVGNAGATVAFRRRV